MSEAEAADRLVQPIQAADRLVKPIHVTLAVACQITGESRAGLYNAINRGELTAYKAGVRTVLVYRELEERCAARPVGLAKPSAALLDGGRLFRAKKKKKSKRK
jgi:hypothetical protein